MQDALYAKRVPFDTPEASPSMTRCSKSWPSPPTTPRAIRPVNAAPTLPSPVPNGTRACSRWTRLTCSNENAACPSRPTALHFSLGMNYAAASAAWVDRHLINSPMLSGMKENPDGSITFISRKSRRGPAKSRNGFQRRTVRSSTRSWSADPQHHRCNWSLLRQWPSLIGLAQTRRTRTRSSRRSLVD